MEKKIYLPLTEEQAANLKAGDNVLLSGIIYTARDAAHERLVKLIEEKEKLPIELKDSVIYYVGPTPEKPGEIIGSAGPTTSYRMDKYAPILLDLGLKGMIGKGARSEEVNQAYYFRTFLVNFSYFSRIHGIHFQDIVQTNVINTVR